MRAFMHRLLTWSWAMALVIAPGIVVAQEDKKAEAPPKAKQDKAKTDTGKDKTVEELRKEALALNTVRSEESISKKIKELSENKPQARRLVQAALPLLQNKDENTFSYGAANILGSIAVDAREYKAGIEFLKLALDKASKVKSDKKIFSNRMLLIEAYLADQRAADAEKIAEKMINPNLASEEAEDQNMAVVSVLYGRVFLVRATMMQGAFDRAQKHHDILEKMFLREEGVNPAVKELILRNKAFFLQYKGDLKAAIKTYEELVEEADNDEEKTRYQEQIGNIYADLGEVEKAYDLMSGLLKKNPDSPGLNNDLGYILAVHNRKLDEAEKMVKKAVEKDPENPSFLDSMAWVYYKQKKYKEAKEWMMKAIAHERGRNTELMEHLGDIQLALGEKDEAKQSFEKALAAVSPSHKDQQRKPEIEKKLKEMGK
jgi:tetratricopeptide (TPR) repeat protein